MAKDENYKMQVTMPTAVADRVQTLAEMLGHTESRMASLLLEAAVTDQAWFENWMAAKVAQTLKVFQDGKLSKRKPAKS